MGQPFPRRLLCVPALPSSAVPSPLEQSPQTDQSPTVSRSLRILEGADAAPSSPWQSRCPLFPAPPCWTIISSELTKTVTSWSCEGCPREAQRRDLGQRHTNHASVPVISRPTFLFLHLFSFERKMYFLTRKQPAPPVLRTTGSGMHRAVLGPIVGVSAPPLEKLQWLILGGLTPTPPCHWAYLRCSAALGRRMLL